MRLVCENLIKYLTKIFTILLIIKFQLPVRKGSLEKWIETLTQRNGYTREEVLPFYCFSHSQFHLEQLCALWPLSSEGFDWLRGAESGSHWSNWCCEQTRYCPMRSQTSDPDSFRVDSVSQTGSWTERLEYATLQQLQLRHSETSCCRCSLKAESLQSCYNFISRNYNQNCSSWYSECYEKYSFNGLAVT